MTSFFQVYGDEAVKLNFFSSPNFWRHGRIMGESATHLFFEDKLEGRVSIALHDIKAVVPEKKLKEVKRTDDDG